MNPVDRIVELFAERGSSAYLGEPVSQLEHALQAAQCAVRDEASDALVCAALLHDIGHLLGPEDNPAERGIDGHHENSGCAWLARWFPLEVTAPVRLHVSAKRYLCATEPGYFAALSPASVLSLKLQGGPFSQEEAAEFERTPHWQDAVRLRRWDDEAKVQGLKVPELEAYQVKLSAAVRP